MEIRTIPRVATWIAVFAAATLAACATQDSGYGHGGQHGGGQSGGAMMGGAQGGGGMMGGGQGGGMMGAGQGGGMMGGSMMGGGGQAGASATPSATTPMDREAMCSVYHSMQNAPTQEQRQAIMDQHMQGMTPQMREHHMDMMRQQCSY